MNRRHLFRMFFGSAAAGAVLGPLPALWSKDRFQKAVDLLLEQQARYYASRRERQRQMREWDQQICGAGHKLQEVDARLSRLKQLVKELEDSLALRS